MAIISLKILTPEKIIYEDDISEIVIPTESGEIGILPNHSPLVSVIKSGEIKIYKEQGEMISLSISTGTLEVRPSNKEKGINSEVIILASRSEMASGIDVKRAEKAYQRAQKAMEEIENISDVDFARFQAMMDKELNRVKIGKKYRR